MAAQPNFADTAAIDRMKALADEHDEADRTHVHAPPSDNGAELHTRVSVLERAIGRAETEIGRLRRILSLNGIDAPDGE